MGMNEYAERDAILKEWGFSGYEDWLNRSRLHEEQRAQVVAGGRPCFVCQERSSQMHHMDYSAATLAGAQMKSLVPVCDRCHGLAERDPRDNRKRPLKHANEMMRQYRIILRQKAHEVWDDVNASGCTLVGNSGGVTVYRVSRLTLEQRMRIWVYIGWVGWMADDLRTESPKDVNDFTTIDRELWSDGSPVNESEYGIGAIFAIPRDMHWAADRMASMIRHWLRRSPSSLSKWANLSAEDRTERASAIIGLVNEGARAVKAAPLFN